LRGGLAVRSFRATADVAALAVAVPHELLVERFFGLALR